MVIYSIANTLAGDIFTDVFAVNRWPYNNRCSWHLEN
jgi:hypothetical protein